MHLVVSRDLNLLAIMFGSLLVSAGCGGNIPTGPQPDLTEVLKIRESLGGGAGTPSGGAAPAEATGTGWGSIKGVFRLTGNPPQMPRLPVSGADTAVCSPGGSAPLAETLVVDSSNQGIGNIAVYARKVRRVHDDAKQAVNPEVVFDQKNCIFLSHVASIQIGQTLKILNSDPVGHNTNIAGRVDSNKFNQSVPSGNDVLFKPGREENTPIPISCSIHPWMSSYLLARENGYFAITKPDGSFEISNLPAGEEVEIQAWHEAGAGRGGGLALDRKDLNWGNNGRFKVLLQEDEVRDLGNLEVPVTAFRVMK